MPVADTPPTPPATTPAPSPIVPAPPTLSPRFHSGASLAYPLSGPDPEEE